MRTRSEAVAGMLSRLAEANGLDDVQGGKDKAAALPAERFEVVVQCRSSCQIIKARESAMP